MKQIAYSPGFDSLASCAKQAAAQIRDMVALGKEGQGKKNPNKVAPEKFLVMMGEHHYQIAHQFFQVAFLQEMKRNCVSMRLMDEFDIGKQPIIEAVRKRSDFREMAAAIAQKLDRKDNVVMPCAFAMANDIPYFAVDMDAEKSDIASEDIQKKWKNSGAVPVDVAQKLCANPFFKDIFEENKCLTTSKNLYATSYHGQMQRDIMMYHNITKTMAQNKKCALNILATGLDHVANATAPGKTALAEMLLHNGYQLVTVGLHSPDGSFSRAHKKVLSNLSADALKNYQAHIDVTIDNQAEENFSIKKYWTKLEKCQKDRAVAF